jgi:hypothetical protein
VARPDAEVKLGRGWGAAHFQAGENRGDCGGADSVANEGRGDGPIVAANHAPGLGDRSEPEIRIERFGWNDKIQENQCLEWRFWCSAQEPKNSCDADDSDRSQTNMGCQARAVAEQDTGRRAQRAPNSTLNRCGKLWKVHDVQEDVDCSKMRAHALGEVWLGS